MHQRSKTILVEGTDFDSFPRDELVAACSTVGTVVTYEFNCEVARITYKEESEAKEAVWEFNGADLNGRTLHAYHADT